MAEPEIEIDIDIPAQELLLAAANHDIPRVKDLLKSTTANAQDPETGRTPLHAAIESCESDDEDDEDGVVEAKSPEEQEVLRKEKLNAARETVQILLENGAIWNDLDLNEETPGCIALRLGLTEIYEMMVDAGVRAELILSKLDEYQRLEDDDGENEEEQETAMNTDGVEKSDAPSLVSQNSNEENKSSSPAREELAQATDPADSNSLYLSSSLSFTSTSVLDSAKGAVMMAWESNLMSRTASLLLPSSGLRVLNIGFGMGIIDTAFQSHSPSLHHIIEAHPDVLKSMKQQGWYDKQGVTIHEGRWQDVLPKLLEKGDLLFDAIYFDTYAESYADMRQFFTDYVIGLLDQDGQWSFFNGMGADRRICYDVYQKVVEIDLFEAGFDVKWQDVDVGDLESKGEWQDVKRKYWVLNRYRLPLCKFLG